MAITQRARPAIDAPQPVAGGTPFLALARSAGARNAIITGGLCLWAAGVPLALLWQLEGTRGVAAGALIITALGVAGWVTSEHSWRSRVVLPAFAILTLLAGFWLLRPVNQTWLVELVKAPFIPSLSDYLRLGGAAVDLAVLMGVLGIGAGIFRRGVSVPLGLLLAVPASLAVALLAPTAAWTYLAPSTLLVGAAVPIGRRLTRVCVSDAEAAVPLAWPIWICIGLGVISVLWLGIGSLGLLTPMPLIGSVLLLLLFAYEDVWVLVRGLRSVWTLLQHPIDLRREALSVAVGVVLAGLFLMNLMPAVAPDVGSDSVMAHMAVAYRFAQQGSLAGTDETQVFYWQIPVQVLYAGLLSSSSFIGSKVLHFWYGLLAAGATATLAASLSGQRRAGLFAAAVFSTTAIAWWLSQSAWVDFPLTFYFLACMCALVQWARSGRRGWLVAAGIAAGVAIPSKLTNVALVPIIVAVILYYDWHDTRRAIVDLVIAGTAVFVSWLPWPLRSYILAGNPAFPWFNQIFHSPLVEPVAVFAGTPLGIGTRPSAILSLPWVTAFSPETFAATLGPHFLALTPLLLFISWRSPATRGIGIVFSGALIFSLIWAYGLLQNMRYLMPATPLFATLIGMGWARLESDPRRVLAASAAVAVLFLAVLTNALTPTMWWLKSSSSPGMPYRVLLGTVTPDDFIHSQVQGAAALAHANRLYRGNAKIWAPFMANSRIYSEAPIYYSDPFTALPVRDHLQALQSELDPRVLQSRLRELGFTHLLMSGSLQARFLPDAARPAFLKPEFLYRYCEFEYADAGTVLCRVLDSPTGRAPIVQTLFQSDFEAGDGATPVGWSAVGPVQWDRSGTVAHQGQAAVEVGSDRTVMTTKLIPVTEGAVYRLRLHARAEQSDTAGLYWIQYVSAEQKLLRGAWQRFVPGGEYVAFDYLATAPPGATAARIIVAGITDNRRSWIDDVTLDEVSFPASP